MGAIPEIGGAAKGIVSSVVDSELNKMWRDALYKEIVDAIGRSHAEQALSSMRSGLQSISQHFNQLRTLQLSNDDVRTKVHIIHNKFMEILNLYSDESVIFRKYPQFTITLFASIVILLKIFESIREKYIPNLSTKALACRFQDQIEEYRNLHVFYRLDGIEFPRTLGKTDHGASRKIEKRDDNAAAVINLDYDSTGYNGNNDFICCDGKHCDGYGVRCIKDQDSMYAYPEGDRDRCSSDYMRLLRHRIENAYDMSKQGLNDICTKSVRSERKATGRGWLTIIFTTAHGKYLPNTGGACDPFFLFGPKASATPCDLYVELEIDGRHEFSTKEKEGYDVSFYEMYRSRKSSKHQSVELRLMDSDTGDDDQLIKWQGKIGDLIDTLSRRIQYEDNYFDIIVHWRDEFEDEI